MALGTLTVEELNFCFTLIYSLYLYPPMRIPRFQWRLVLFILLNLNSKENPSNTYHKR